MENQENQGELSWGEKQAGVSFNPSQDQTVGHIKANFAALMDELNDLRTAATSGDVKRFYSMALTELNHAQMDAVKAATWNL